MPLSNFTVFGARAVAKDSFRVPPAIDPEQLFELKTGCRRGLRVERSGAIYPRCALALGEGKSECQYDKRCGIARWIAADFRECASRKSAEQIVYGRDARNKWLAVFWFAEADREIETVCEFL